MNAHQFLTSLCVIFTFALLGFSDKGQYSRPLIYKPPKYRIISLLSTSYEFADRREARRLTQSKKKTSFRNLRCRPRNKGSEIFMISLGSNIGGIFHIKQIIEFSGLYSEIKPATLTNPSACTNWGIQ